MFGYIPGRNACGAADLIDEDWQIERDVMEHVMLIVMPVKGALKAPRSTVSPCEAGSGACGACC